MQSSMLDTPLSISLIFESGLSRFPDSLVTEYRAGLPVVRRTFADVADEVRSLAAALAALGIGRDDMVATLCWNTTEHLAAYFAIPSMGAVLHTLNLRLHDDQLEYIVGHARDRVLITSADLLPRVEQLLGRMPTIEHLIVKGGGDIRVPESITVHDYDDLIAAHAAEFSWPEVEERSAAILCYTSGTTGNPKGVAYSHRSIYLHSLMLCTGSVMGFTEYDALLPIVPMFHANAWGWPHAGWLAGSTLIMNGRFLSAPDIATIIETLEPTVAAAVPTIWTSVADHAAANGVRLTSLRRGIVGGSTLTRALARKLWDQHGVRLIQGWGMTETSPLLTLSEPPRDRTDDALLDCVTQSGRLVPGVFARIMDDAGRELPHDGVSVGEIELRGPTIAGRYFRADDDSGTKFHDGWLRTGDAGVIDRHGWVDVRDRIKDGIKSGGEWISSVELESRLIDHPGVAEAAVIGIPDPRWEERPLAVVALRDGSEVSVPELRAHLDGQVAKWAVPDHWRFVGELPKTSVGKIDKKELRTRFG
ncbi:long-chain fatty acid--CoA ligase [Nocardia australiensis]|uniref:long-chain fatty acid--CoA ligase n=1 Tax=Nocardia australiensis TaxID=2887191 RepID=UPI001D13506B|nr:long-chain fatty acid--CoA ligase [Nocardia australiensis]